MQAAPGLNSHEVQQATAETALRHDSTEVASLHVSRQRKGIY
jgi:hypothetical protein